ncbi:Rossmann-fold NAD(P)(+)-binding protein [Moelleriella libera RCEF 2490]|uniref:Rossmann-fold NAD(P)(+)-binding protein n=1 Tax=Moelleriella libera RCEF 2490 TaxID=1081109 RepID=A0A168ATD2_9HYPO|nr:Rossmann-fold NAD(P)(+)-binding protein [Moelleriella libera RCEF 2490]
MSVKANQVAQIPRFVEKTARKSMLTFRKRMARIHELEILRQDAIHKARSITRDEEARLLQLRLLTMRDENANLREKLGQRDFTISSLTREMDEIRLHQDEGQKTIRAQDSRIKKQELDLEDLKAEIEALNGSRQDSGKALQEKFALSRELDRIRPELEHLQSQLTAYQGTVVEKNELRRQLDVLEVELENERRAKQRLQSRSNQEAAVADLTSRLEEAEKKLASEKKENEKARKEHERQIAAAKADKERLEERISSLKEKSKTLQAELKEARGQLEEARSEIAAASKARPVSRPVGGGGDDGEEKPKRSVTLKAELGKKRRAPVMSFEEIVIQTPGNDLTARERPKKKRGGEKATVGEKSAFSVTPFLSRSKSLTDDSGKEDSSHNASTEAEPESPLAESPAQIESEEEALKPKVSFKSSVSFKSPTKPAKAKEAPLARPVPLGESTPAKANKVVKSRAAAPAATAPKPKSIPEAISIDKSIADSSATDQENLSSISAANSVAAAAAAAATAAAPVAKKPRAAPSAAPPKQMPEGEVKKKKRKLLGAANKTLFDEDDDEDGEAITHKPLPALALAAGKRTKARLGGGLRNAFASTASFSPLKRDRRGVNASFLV